ncbi:MAG: flippase [Methanobacterium sp. ERen5]|nr:MAG: flippase [Methanobacterium sp. ERen5]
MGSERTLAKNTTVLLVANIMSYLLGFFTTLYTARYLGVEGFGILSLALSITGIFGVLTDFGLTTLTIREVSRDNSLANKYIGNTAVMKLFLSLLTFGVIGLLVYIMGYPQTVANVIYIITLSVVMTAFTGIFNSIFQAYEKMEYLSLTIVLTAVIMISGILLVIYRGLDIVVLSSVYLFSSLLVFILTFIIFSKRFFMPSIRLDLSFWKLTLQESFYFGVSSILVVIYFYIDSLMLSVMVNYSAVGIYNAAYKLIFVLMFLPNVFLISIFPLMSQHFESNRELLKVEYEKSVKYLFAIAMFFFVFVLLFADKIIYIIYGSGYDASILALQALIFVVPVIFITYLFGNILGAINKQRILLIVTAINAIINVALNLVLIPHYSYVGASFATVITEVTGFSLMILYISKYFSRISWINNFLKTIVVSVLVLTVTYILKLNINWIIALVAGVVLFLVLMFVTKIISKEDIEIFKRMLKKDGNL